MPFGPNACGPYTGNRHGLHDGIHLVYPFHELSNARWLCPPIVDGACTFVAFVSSLVCAIIKTILIVNEFSLFVIYFPIILCIVNNYQLEDTQTRINIVKFLVNIDVKLGCNQHKGYRLCDSAYPLSPTKPTDMIWRTVI
jgi:hypothetical protein